MLSNISKLYHNYHFEKNTQLLEKKAIFSLHCTFVPGQVGPTATTSV